MNTFIDWDAIQPRLLVGWLPVVYGLDGWLYWMTLFDTSAAAHNSNPMRLNAFAHVRRQHHRVVV